jgi:putative addiction module component (TIGR02574 family)
MLLPEFRLYDKVQNRTGGHQMSDRGTQLLKEALSLPPGERAEIAERLLSSLDSPERRRIDALWTTEAEDRLDAYEQGEIKAIPAERVFDRMGPKTK